MSCTPDEDKQRRRQLTDLVADALVLYTLGTHPTPNLWTKNGNVRAWRTANGVVARCQKFQERETERGRVRARSHHVARAQDLLTIASEEHGAEETVEELIAQILATHAPQSSDDEDDGFGDERWVGARDGAHAHETPTPHSTRTPTTAPWPMPPAGVSTPPPPPFPPPSPRGRTHVRPTGAERGAAQRAARDGRADET